MARKVAAAAAAAALLACGGEREPYNVCRAWFMQTADSAGRFAAEDARAGLERAGLKLDPVCVAEHREDLIALSHELCPVDASDPRIELRPYQAALAKRLAELCPIAG